MRGRGYVLSDFVKSSPKRREYYENTKWLARLLETEEKDGPRMSFFCKPICRCAAHIWMPRLLAPFCFLGSGPDSDRPRGGVYFGGGGGLLAHTARCKLQTAALVTPESPTPIGLLTKGLLSSACQPVPPPRFFGGVRPGQATTKISLYEEAITRLQDWLCSNRRKKKKKARSTGEIDGCVINSKQGKKEEKACQRQKRER